MAVENLILKVNFSIWHLSVGFTITYEYKTDNETSGNCLQTD